MSTFSFFGLGAFETAVLLIQVVLVAACIGHLSLRSGYGEARMRFVRFRAGCRDSLSHVCTRGDGSPGHREDR